MLCYAAGRAMTFPGEMSDLRCGKVILVVEPCADMRQANGATDLGPQPAAAR
jgi:hypothetical protein